MPSVLIIFVNRCSVCVFCIGIFSNKHDLFEATCFILQVQKIYETGLR